MARGPAGAAADGAGRAGQWVHTWVAMPQLTEESNLPPAPFMRPGSAFADATLRQTVRVSVGARFLRLRVSNAFGGAALPITAASLARPVAGRAGASGIEPDSVRPVTFSGNTSVTVPVGAQAVSDPVEFPSAGSSNVAVNLYLAEGQASDSITSHPGSRTTTHMVAGNHLDDPGLAGAASVEHWYFISGLEAWSPPGTAAAVMIGDSLTDGRGSTTDGNDRWPDQLLGRLQADRRTARVAVLNQGAGGNRVLHDGLGPNALGRIDRDVLAQSGVKWLVVFEGVNDIGTGDATHAAQKQVADELIAAYRQIVTRAHAAGIRVYGASVTPFGGSDYDDPQGLREATRHTVNTWIREGGRFDAVLDFDAAVRDPAHPRRLQAAYDVGDHLHMTPSGYAALAHSVPTELFTQRPLPQGFGFE